MPRWVGALHEFQAEVFDPVVGQRQANQAASVLGHEIDGVGIGHLGGNDDVALVLAVLVVDEDDHAPLLDVLNDLLDGRQVVAR